VPGGLRRCSVLPADQDQPKGARAAAAPDAVEQRYGTNCPRQDDIRARPDRLAQALRTVYDRLAATGGR
jgi:hypothetical protein